jgi:hypothetical protein
MPPRRSAHCHFKYLGLGYCLALRASGFATCRRSASRRTLMTLVAHTVPTKKPWFLCSARSCSRAALAMTFGVAQFGANEPSQAKPHKDLIVNQAWDPHVIRLAQADRCWRSQCGLAEAVSGQWIAVHSAARLAPQRLQLCRCHDRHDLKEFSCRRNRCHRQ